MDLCSAIFAIVAILLTVLIIKHHKFIYIVIVTFPRDIRIAKNFLKVNILLWYWEVCGMTVPIVFQKTVKRYPKKTALVFENKEWTYQDIENYSNQVANYFRKEGFQRGDAIGLLMENRPEYMCIWLGLSKIGMVTALINNNLVAEPLLHSISAAKCKALIYGANYVKTVGEIQAKVFNTLKLYQFNDQPDQECLPGSKDVTATNESTKPPMTDINEGRLKDKLMYIYTSGTTGLPKAAVITHARFLFMTSAIGKMAEISSDDVIYDPLPLYHSAGGIVGIGQCIYNGNTVVIRKKFSASNFWSDCQKYKCTVAQYIGEICRYILAVHSADKPVEHSVRMMLGNGLKPQIWKEFVERFHIKQICEFYGSTEGNSNMINTENKIGAVGFFPIYSEYFYPVCLVKCDESTGEPIRNEDGFCTKCKPGEPGVFIGKIQKRTAVTNFQGYADEKATKKKILTNVFKPGDMYFNSGDILIKDDYGYFYFKDRTGDTFRWKGENVATTEIEAVISNIVNFKDATVYGVEIPNTEGRAGMAAIVDSSNTLDLDQLAKGLKAKLPAYAIPIFIRVSATLPLTGTFKLKKKELQDDAFNIHKVEDPLYFYDAKKAQYVRLTEQLYEDIMTQKIRL